MKNPQLGSVALLIFLATRAVAAPIPPAVDAAITTDPARDAAHPAAMYQLTIPSHDASMFGVFYRAAGGDAHPTVLMLHGLPGFEQNGDLAQTIRRAGWNVLIFHYRGAWGSGGTFSFSNCVEDVRAALEYLRAAGECRAARDRSAPARADRAQYGRVPRGHYLATRRLRVRCRFDFRRGIPGCSRPVRRRSSTSSSSRNFGVTSGRWPARARKGCWTRRRRTPRRGTWWGTRVCGARGRCWWWRRMIFCTRTMSRSLTRCARGPAGRLPRWG